MSLVQIIKSDGRKEDLDIKKIRTMINRMTDNLNLNPLKLEASIQKEFKNNTHSKEVQELVIKNSSNLTSIDEPEWAIASGRGYMFNLYKEAWVHNKNSYDVDYLDFLKTAIKKGKYTNILDFYTEKEIHQISKELRPERDLNYNIGAAISWNKKYLVKIKGKVFELPQQAFLTLSLIEMSREKEDRMQKVKKLYHELSTNKMSLATPFLSNLRVPGGNLSSCYITIVEDTIEGINYNEDMLTLISKAGGGVGSYLGKLRCSGSYMGDVLGLANEINLWVKKINDIAVAVNQNGKRKGAITVGLDWWYKDIYAFLEVGSETGDQRTKAHDIFPQMIINKLFLDRKKKNEDIWLVDNHEIMKKLGKEYDLTELHGPQFVEKYLEIEDLYEKGKLVNGIKANAKELWKKCLASSIETGKTFIAHKDNLNFFNPLKDYGTIQQGNLCTESFSLIKAPTNFRTTFENGEVVRKHDVGMSHTCNLVSLNFSEINTDRQLETTSRLSVRVLDNAVDFTVVPIPEGLNHNNLMRTIGIGGLGLADWMAKRNLSYEKEEDTLEVEKLYEKVFYYTVDESIELAKERGAFPLYEHSEYKKGIINGRNLEEMKAISNCPELDYDLLFSKLALYGIRNAHIHAVAPNTSTSVLMGCSASYLPVYGKLFYEENGNLVVPTPAKFIKEKLWYYKEYKNIHPKHIIRLTIRLQKWIDTGMSMELILNKRVIPSIKELDDELMNFFDNGGKTVYYIRTFDPENNDDDKKAEEDCSSCKN